MRRKKPYEFVNTLPGFCTAFLSSQKNHSFCARTFVSIRRPEFLFVGDFYPMDFSVFTFSAVILTPVVFSKTNPLLSECVLYENVLLKTHPTRKRSKFHDYLVIFTLFTFCLTPRMTHFRFLNFYVFSVSNVLFERFTTFKTRATYTSQTII